MFPGEPEVDRHSSILKILTFPDNPGFSLYAFTYL
jgi:hypothetical protein